MALVTLLREWSHDRGQWIDKGSVIQCKVEEVELPVKQVDVIVSEWMVRLPMISSPDPNHTVAGLYAVVRVDARFCACVRVVTTGGSTS